MKKIIYLILLISTFSCQKEFKSVNDNRTNYLKQIDGYLKANMQPQDYLQVELEKSATDTATAIQKLFTRIPFKNKPFNTDFILLETDFSGVNSSGKIISLPKEFFTTFPFTGTIHTNNLSRTNPQALQTRKKTTSNSQSMLPAPSSAPEQTIKEYDNLGNGYYANWINTNSIIYGNNGNATVPYSGGGVSNGTTYFAYYINPNNIGGGNANAVENDYSDYYTGEDITEAV